jgi:FKBP-type peptidyl-prolyl cis-trans isomerase FklB
MKRGLRFLPLVALLLFQGCGPKEPSPPSPPSAPVKSDLELKREKYFGPAVVTDASVDWRSTGLGVKMLVLGDGPAPQFSDRVRVHYTVRLVNGTVVDDTRAKGKPSVFAVSKLVRGLTDGLGFLKTGGRAIFYIPPSLGYGNMQAGIVPPLSGLIFDVELLEVLPAE